ncbi:MAG: site-specific DNA-methyltransferase [Dehalococcoidia bacterium]|nr:site-specific DNA-methyltransferase [Dehalococcoidia bacterium]MDW8120012.1 site-specific DNA-methyltransferase [Chloroflexota bacterium]
MEEGQVRLYNKSCEQMDEVPDGSVHLVVTSPPYWNSIDYAQHTANPRAWYRTRNGGPYHEYLDWLERCFREVYRTIIPGGYCAVVLGTVLFERQYYPLPYHFVPLMERIGFSLEQDIIWHKVTGGLKRAGVTIQHPYPGYYKPNIMTECILVFRTPGQHLGKRRTLQEKERDKIPIDQLFTHELANNIWHIAPVPPGQYDHPCPFPEEIPYRLIVLYTYRGDTVLDPFAGSGTTLKVARHLGRRAIGYEVEPKYVALAQRRVREPLHLRSLLVPRYTKVAWHPAQLPLRVHEGDKPSASRLPVGTPSRVDGMDSPTLARMAS